MDPRFLLTVKGYKMPAIIRYNNMPNQQACINNWVKFIEECNIRWMEPTRDEIYDFINNDNVLLPHLQSGLQRVFNMFCVDGIVTDEAARIEWLKRIDPSYQNILVVPPYRQYSNEVRDVLCAVVYAARTKHHHQFSPFHFNVLSLASHLSIIAKQIYKDAYAEYVLEQRAKDSPITTNLR